MTSKGFSMRLPVMAGSLSLALGMAYFYYSLKNPKNESFNLSRTTVIQILKSFKKEFYILFKNLTIASQKIQAEYRARYNISPDEMSEILHMHLVEENPTFKPQVQDIEEKIYNKFDVINRSEFEKLCGKMARNDPEIQGIIEEIKQLFKDAILGVSKNKVNSLHEDFTADLTAEIYRKSIKEVLTKVMTYVEKYIGENGSIGLGDDKFHMGLQALSLDNIKNKVLQESGLPLSEEFHPQQIFAFAISKFSREDLKFSEKISRVEKFNQEFMQKMFLPGVSFDDLKKDLDKINDIYQFAEPVIQLRNESGKDQSPFDVMEIEQVPIEELHIEELEVKESSPVKEVIIEVKEIKIEEKGEDREEEEKSAHEYLSHHAEESSPEKMEEKAYSEENLAEEVAPVDEARIEIAEEEGFFNSMSQNENFNALNNKSAHSEKIENSSAKKTVLTFNNVTENETNTFEENEDETLIADTNKMLNISSN